MKQLLTFLVFVLLANTLTAQTYKDSILSFRQQYKNDFLTDEQSPLTAADTGYLRFYKVDPSYRVLASFKATKDAVPFTMQTHSGKLKTYKEYGVLTFSIHGTKCKLHVYSSIDLIAEDPKFSDYLFIPFTDETNYKETFGGGRYFDISVTDIKNNKLLLDFNKCYNPLCAFKEGYSCPIPPRENSLHIAIRAGEKLFGKEVMPK